METIIGILRATLFAALIYGGYLVYPYVQKELAGETEAYEIEVESVRKEIEAPTHLTGYSFKSDDGVEVYFTSNNSCELRNFEGGIGMDIKGQPTAYYQKIDKEKAVLKLRYTTAKNEGREVLEYDYSYEYELNFIKNYNGRANLNYVIIHKMGAGESIRTFTEANNRPTHFTLSKA